MHGLVVLRAEDDTLEQVLGEVHITVRKLQCHMVQKGKIDKVELLQQQEKVDKPCVWKKG